MSKPGHMGINRSDCNRNDDKSVVQESVGASVGNTDPGDLSSEVWKYALKSTQISDKV
jgi:hypothetical protein